MTVSKGFDYSSCKSDNIYLKYEISSLQVVLLMSFRLKPLFFVTSSLFCLVLLTFPLSASAGAGGDIAESVDQNTQQDAADKTVNTKQITDALDASFVKMAKAVAPVEQTGLPSPDSPLQSSLTGMPQALMLVDTTTRDLLTNRLLEFNLVSATATTGKPADYLIDPHMVSVKNAKVTIEAPAQVFDIFMRYFCDPKSRGGTMQKLNNVPSDKYGTKLIGCGGIYESDGKGHATNIDPSTPSRDAIFGKEPDDPASLTDPVAAYIELQRGQIKNLPLRPNALFFDASTFPVNMAKGIGDGTTNGNPLANVYYGAFAQALHFLIGVPQPAQDLGTISSVDDQMAFIDKQGLIARQMLASYPFAVLFAERVGSLDANIAQATSQMLIDKIGPLGQKDVILYNRIQNLASRQSLSIAEYMDIVMYQVPMSPGYLNRINKLEGADLQREKIWLTAMQTALNYQRNRWLEMLTALEATK
jgi:hypothetical protein